MNSTQIACQLWERLWQDYRRRVSYACVYQQMIEEAGGTVANDHIAFRSLRLSVERDGETLNLGIPYLAQIVEKLGYKVAGEYHFPNTHLYAHHYRHPLQTDFDLPKLFISELLVDELPPLIGQMIRGTVEKGDFLASNAFGLPLITSIDRLQAVFTSPWQPPKRSVVEAVNQVTQYGAWVLLHGYAVNHFTGYVNHQNTPCYNDIEATVAGLIQRGIPMKATIEGSCATGLRQTATQAVTESVAVWDDTKGDWGEIPWTYAYYEIAERNLVEVAGGEKQLFEGFLDAQAQNLFEMTRKS